MGISESLIKEVKNWLYVIFVHRLDKGGQFVSYRKIERWRNAIACQIQKCTTSEEVQQLENAIRRDWKKHNKQYEDVVLQFLEKIWDQRRKVILKDLTKEYSKVSLPSL